MTRFVGLDVSQKINGDLHYRQCRPQTMAAPEGRNCCAEPALLKPCILHLVFSSSERERVRLDRLSSIHRT
jgi:hypothetical protein